MLNAESLTALAWWPHQCQEGLIGDIALQLVVEVQTLLLLLRLLLPLPLLFTSTISSERHNIKTDWSLTLPCNCCSHHALPLSVTIGGEHWAGVETKSNKWNNYFSLTLASFLFVFTDRLKNWPWSRNCEANSTITILLIINVIDGWVWGVWVYGSRSPPFTCSTQACALLYTTLYISMLHCALLYTTIYLNFTSALIYTTLYFYILHCALPCNTIFYRMVS